MEKNWESSSKKENELWDAFKAATDAFNDKKSENLEELRAIEQKNYELKLALVKQAISIKEAENNEKGHQKMQDLMAQWKKIGRSQEKNHLKFGSNLKKLWMIFMIKEGSISRMSKTHKENLKKKK